MGVIVVPRHKPGSLLRTRAALKDGCAMLRQAMQYREGSLSAAGRAVDIKAKQLSAAAEPTALASAVLLGYSARDLGRNPANTYMVMPQ